MLILLLGCCGSLFAQEGVGERVLLIGRLVERDSVTAVPFAFVANSQTGFGKESDERGMFKLNTGVGDTLFFRCLGYQDTLLVINEQMLRDSLFWIVQKQTFELGEVQVLMFKSYASFRHMVANMDMLPTKSKGMSMGFTMNDLRRAEKERSGTFGLTARFGRGSTTKAEKRYEALLDEEKRDERLRELTSRQNMRYFTKLDGADLDSFMVFLRTKHKINPALSDYKIMEAVSQAFEMYIVMRNDTTKLDN
ncbi:hypothetical protein [Carboxylicivirga taeanensis]|uniref:hypothetical protein n=1 Tax=Carboxylicivirga taeanensis TaxID=1416875 RepID=UPI003F6E0945